MNKISYKAILTELNRVLPAGVFLTVKDGEKLNTMTMGWATVGYMWNRPVFMIPVRESRYTHELLEDTNEFTVSVPLNNQFKEELEFCGTKSGRDYDKFKEMNLETMTVNEGEVPVIKGNDLHFVCKIKYRHDLDGNKIDNEILEKNYRSKDFHTLYIGEILAVYREKLNS